MGVLQTEVNAIKHYPFTDYNISPHPTAPPQTENKSAWHSLAAVGNTTLKSALPVGKTLCRWADSYPLSLLFIAVGVTCVIAGPSVYILPLCAAALMISAGRLIKLRAPQTEDALHRQEGVVARQLSAPFAACCPTVGKEGDTRVSQSPPAPMPRVNTVPYVPGDAGAGTNVNNGAYVNAYVSPHSDVKIRMHVCAIPSPRS